MTKTNKRILFRWAIVYLSTFVILKSIGLFLIVEDGGLMLVVSPMISILIARSSVFSMGEDPKAVNNLLNRIYLVVAMVSFALLFLTPLLLKVFSNSDGALKNILLFILLETFLTCVSFGSFFDYHAFFSKKELVDNDINVNDIKDLIEVDKLSDRFNLMREETKGDLAKLIETRELVDSEAPNADETYSYIDGELTRLIEKELVRIDDDKNKKNSQLIKEFIDENS